MSDNNGNLISRKEFMKKSSAGLLGLGLLGGVPYLYSDSQKTQTSSQYRIIGKTGIRVSSVGFGASRTMEHALLRMALDSGINFIDTGRSYFDGQNEVMVGKVIRDMRKEVVVQSKLRVRLMGRGEKLMSAEKSKKIHDIMQSSLEKSLKALQTDYIDIMLIHGASSIDIINNEAVMEFFRLAKKKGQIRACGFSTHINQAETIRAASESKFYDSVMVTFNHKGSYVHTRSGNYREWDQVALEKELKKAEKNNIGIIAMKTCSAGPYSPDKETEPSYQAALRWVLNHSFINTMAVAMGNMKEIKEDIQVMF